jgi:hypothetical protein
MLALAARGGGEGGGRTCRDKVNEGREMVYVYSREFIHTL